MADPWAIPSDVIDSWVGDGAPTTADTALITRWIAKAERKLRADLPDLAGRLAETPPEPDLAENVTDVIVAMVTRVLRNPEGVRTRQEAEGPFSASITFGGDTPGGLYVTDDELALLSPRRAGQKAFTVTPGQFSDVTHPLYGALVNGPDSWAPGAAP